MPINYGTNDVNTSGIITAVSGNFSVLNVNQTANTIATFDANKNIVSVSSPTLTELSHISGISSNIQTQLNNKANTNQTMFIGTTSVAINRTSASQVLTGVSIESAGQLTTQPGERAAAYIAQIGATTSGLFPASDNSNSILTVGRHAGNFYSQLGFSSNSNLYYRAFNNTAINTTAPWQTIWTNSSLPNPAVGVGTSGYYTRWITTSGVGTGVIYDNGTNVGIGTTAPSGQLHVIGSGIFSSGIFIPNNTSIRTETATGSQFNILRLDQADNVRLERPNASSDMYIAASTAFILKGNDRVGMGHVSPLNRLAVSGAVSIGSTNNVLAPQNGLLVEGNVGIGTTTPSSQLHVIGSGIFSSGIRVGNSATNGFIVGPSGNTFIQFNNSEQNRIDINSNTYANSHTYISTQSFTIFSAGTYCNGSFQFPIGGLATTSTATQRDSNPLNFFNRMWDGSAEKQGKSTIEVKASTTTNLLSRLAFSTHLGDGTTTTAERMCINSTNGNVGIGTSTPSGQLHVIGSGIFSSGIRVGDSSTNGYIYGPSGNANIQFNNVGSNRIDITCTEFFVASTTNLNGSSTRVNGTFSFPRTGSTPTSTATQTNPNELRFFNGLWNGSSAYDGFNTIHSIASTSVSGASRLAFLINNGDGTQNRTERLSITSTSGNVGINNTNPQYTLDVNGNANISGILSVSGVPLGEIIDDEVAGLLLAGSGISLNYNDAANTLTIDTNASTSLSGGNGVSLDYNSNSDTLVINTVNFIHPFLLAGM